MAQADVFAMLDDKESANVVHAHHYNEAMFVLSKLGNVDGCVRILDAMMSRNMRVHRTTMNSIIAACAKAADAQGAEHWWRQMIDRGHWPNRATYASVIHGWARAGNMQRAEEWLLAMKAAGFSPAKGFCRPIVHILLQDQDGELDEEENPGDDEADFRQRQVDDVACKEDIRKADKATKWLQYFHKLGVTLDRSTINLLSSVYARNGEADKVEQWFLHMGQAGISPNQSTYQALVVAHANAGNAERARRWADEMAKIGFEQSPAVLTAMERLQSGAVGTFDLHQSWPESLPRSSDISVCPQLLQQQAIASDADVVLPPRGPPLQTHSERWPVQDANGDSSSQPMYTIETEQSGSRPSSHTAATPWPEEVASSSQNKGSGPRQWPCPPMTNLMTSAGSSHPTSDFEPVASHGGHWLYPPRPRGKQWTGAPDRTTVPLKRHQSSRGNQVTRGHGKQGNGPPEIGFQCPRGNAWPSPPDWGASQLSAALPYSSGHDDMNGKGRGRQDSWGKSQIVPLHGANSREMWAMQGDPLARGPQQGDFQAAMEAIVARSSPPHDYGQQRRGMHKGNGKRIGKVGGGKGSGYHTGGLDQGNGKQRSKGKGKVSKGGPCLPAKLGPGNPPPTALLNDRSQFEGHMRYAPDGGQGFPTQSHIQQNFCDLMRQFNSGGAGPAF